MLNGIFVFQQSILMVFIFWVKHFNTLFKYFFIFQTRMKSLLRRNNLLQFLSIEISIHHLKQSSDNLCTTYCFSIVFKNIVNFGRDIAFGTAVTIQVAFFNIKRKGFLFGFLFK